MFKNIGKTLTKQALPLGAGAIGAKLVKNLAGKTLTFIPAKMIPAFPLIAGVFLMGQKGDLMKNIGSGMVAVGVADLAGQFIPQINGIEDMDLSGIFGDVLNGDDDLGSDDMNGPLNDGVGAAYDENY